MILDWLPTLKKENKVIHPGFEWFHIRFSRGTVFNALYITSLFLHTQEALDDFLAQKLPSWSARIFDSYYSDVEE